MKLDSLVYGFGDYHVIITDNTLTIKWYYGRPYWIRNVFTIKESAKVIYDFLKLTIDKRNVPTLKSIVVKLHNQTQNENSNNVCRQVQKVWTT